MAIVGPWAISVYKGKVDWGVVPVPTANGTTADQTYTFSDAKNVAMYASCTNQGTAWDFLKFSTSQEQDGQLLDPDRPDADAHRPGHDLRRLLRREPGVQAVRRPGRPDRRGPERRRTPSRSGRPSGTPGRTAVIFGKSDVQQAHDGRRDQDRPVGQPAMTTSATRSQVPETTPRPRTRRARVAVGAGPRSPPGCSGGSRSGCCLAAPYAVFIAVVFAYPLGFAVYMSFHDYYFTAPGVERSTPVRRAGQLQDGADRPGRAGSRFCTSAIFLIINVPLTVVLSLGLAVGAEPGDPRSGRSSGRRTTCRT